MLDANVEKVLVDGVNITERLLFTLGRGLAGEASVDELAAFGLDPDDLLASFIRGALDVVAEVSLLTGVVRRFLIYTGSSVVVEVNGGSIVIIRAFFGDRTLSRAVSLPPVSAALFSLLSNRVHVDGAVLG